MEPKLNKGCPEALAAEAREHWTASVETLRTDKYLRGHLVLWRYDATTGALEFLRFLSADEMTADLGQRLRWAEWCRRQIRETGANAVVYAADIWITQIPGIRARFAPDRREALRLTVETRGGGAWVMMQPYSRIGASIFISDEIPPLLPVEPDASHGLMSGWWSPTPSPSNN